MAARSRQGPARTRHSPSWPTRGAWRRGSPIAADDQGERTACSPEPAGTVVYVARAHLAGEPVTVLVRESDEGARTLVVLDAGCAVVSEEPL